MGIALPSIATVDGEEGFVLVGAIFASVGAYLLFRAATKTAAP